MSIEAEYSKIHCTAGLNTPRPPQRGGKANKLQTASLGGEIPNTAGRKVQQITSSRGCKSTEILGMVRNT